MSQYHPEDDGRVLFAALIVVLLLALLLIPGCFSGAIRQPPRAGERNVKLVSRVIDYVGEPAWKSSPYWRSEDQPRWPWFLVLSGDGTGCPVFEHTIHVPLVGEFYQCPVQWRIARRG